MSKKCCNLDTYLVFLLVLWKENCTTCWNKTFRTSLGKINVGTHSCLFGFRAPRAIHLSIWTHRSNFEFSKLPMHIFCWSLFCSALTVSPCASAQGCVLPRFSPARCAISLHCLGGGRNEQVFLEPTHLNIYVELVFVHFHDEGTHIAWAVVDL